MADEPITQPDPSTFVERWNRALGREDTFYKLAQNGVGDVIWLTIVGMPDGASFFSFDDYAVEDRLLPIAERYGRPDDRTNEDRERLTRYLYLGYDGGDNPLCIDTISGGVIQLDHESDFQPYGYYLGSSIGHVAEALLIFEETRAEYERADDLDQTDKDALEERLISDALTRLKALDADVMAGRNFWSNVLNGPYPFS